MLASGTILGSKWSLVKQIGEGACAKVYSVTDVKSSLEYEVVAKVIPLAKSKNKKDKEQERICNTLNYEYILYTGLLMDFPSAPRRPAKFYGDDLTSGVRYLIMERLESDLVGYVKVNPVSPNSIAVMGLQILEGLVWLHQKNFVFVDIKPENFMMKENKLYFVDFGLVERYVPQSTVDARAPGTRAAFAGTPSFCSLSVHKGGVPTGADDIESMGYVLLSLASGGQMPWSDSTSDAECLKVKEGCDIMALATNIGCAEVGRIILDCRRLVSGQAVDYAHCRQLLTNMRDGSASKITATTSAARKASSSSTSASHVASALVPITIKPLSSRQKAKSAAVDLTEEEVVEVAPPAKKARSSKTTSKATTTIEQFADIVTNPARATRTRAVAVPLGAVSSISLGPSEGPFSPSSSSSSTARNTRSSLSPLPVSKLPASTSHSSASSSKPKAVSAVAAATAFSPHATLVSDAPFSLPVTHKSPAPAAQAVSAKSASFWFSASSGPYSGMRHELGSTSASKVTQTTLGRGRGCGVSLPLDDYLSERHLTVKASKKDGLLLQDNGSTNGTKLNGARIAPKEWIPLSCGDVVDVGATKLLVELCK